VGLEFDAARSERLLTHAKTAVQRDAARAEIVRPATLDDEL